MKGEKRQNETHLLPEQKMKKSNITKEFLFDRLNEKYIDMLYAANDITNHTEEDWSVDFRDLLSNMVETLENDSENGDLSDLLNEDQEKELRKIIASDCISYDEYQYCNNLFDDYDFEMDSEYSNYLKIQKEIEKVAELCQEYANIIRDFPDTDYEVDFSERSPSIYLRVKMVPIEENCELFYVEKLGWYCNNVYDDYSDDDRNDMEELEIRLSNHDFGSRYNEWTGASISYEHACVNIFRKFV